MVSKQAQSLCCQSILSVVKVFNENPVHLPKFALDFLIFLINRVLGKLFDKLTYVGDNLFHKTEALDAQAYQLL